MIILSNAMKIVERNITELKHFKEFKLMRRL